MTVRDFKYILDEIEDDSKEIVLYTNEDGSGDIITDFYVKEPDYDDSYAEYEENEDELKDAVKLIPTEYF